MPAVASTATISAEGPGLRSVPAGSRDRASGGLHALVAVVNKISAVSDTRETKEMHHRHQCCVGRGLPCAGARASCQCSCCSSHHCCLGHGLPCARVRASSQYPCCICAHYQQQGQPAAPLPGNYHPRHTLAKVGFCFEANKTRCSTLMRKGRNKAFEVEAGGW